MAYLLFVDESGQDRHESPYEVLAGVAVRDADLWPLINQVHELELRHFGRRYSDGAGELKAKKILKRKTFRQAAQRAPFDADLRQTLAKACLDDGLGATAEMISALAQAKIAFAQDVLQACAVARARVFATMVPADAQRSTAPGLRKDYAYLFERFSYFLEDGATTSRASLCSTNLSALAATFSSIRCVGTSSKRGRANDEQHGSSRSPSSFTAI